MYMNYWNLAQSLRAFLVLFLVSMLAPAPNTNTVFFVIILQLYPVSLEIFSVLSGDTIHISQYWTSIGTVFGTHQRNRRLVQGSLWPAGYQYRRQDRSLSAGVTQTPFVETGGTCAQ